MIIKRIQFIPILFENKNNYKTTNQERKLATGETRKIKFEFKRWVNKNLFRSIVCVPYHFESTMKKSLFALLSQNRKFFKG